MSVSGDILKEGYLVKAPDAARNLHAFKKWQRKWFRLHQNGDLYYYDSEKASKAIGVIHMLQCYRAFDGRSKGLQLSYCVGLEISGENYYLKAESATIFNDWVRVLSKFAEVSEVSLASPSGSPTPERRGTVGAEGAVGEGMLRTGSTASTLSVQSRHFSVATRSRFVKKEGWLAKTGGSNKGWKDRYFVLSNGKLNYFKNEKTDSTQGAIDLFECTNVSKGSGKKGYGFEIEVPDRTFNISAENEHTQSEWIAAIKQTMGVIAEIRSHTQLQEPMQVPRSGSGSSTFSDTSLGSRDLQESTVSASSTLTTSATVIRERHGTPDGSSSFSAAGGPRREEKDSVIQLLEAEVEALRTKVSSLESALASSTTATSQLQDQLAESRGQQEGELRHLREERDNFIAQVLQLERSKSELEAVNDSLQTQLEEHAARIQELEEEGMGLRHELEEVQGGVAASEEELAETQQRLQEIEGIAKELEAALIRKGEDPQTPLLERRRSFTRSLSSSRIIDTKLEQGSTESSLTKSTTATGTSELKQLQQQLERVEQERNDLQEKLNTLKEVQKSVPNKAVSDEEIKKEAAVLLEEGRLKWQMETENMRKEYEAKLEGERQTSAEEKSSQEAALSLAEERYSNLQEACQQQKIEFEKSLTGAQERIQSLESEVSSFQERVGQLQVEKEKAVADLIAIRKINRTMEKKMSEGEVEARPPSANSSQGERVESPDVQQKLLEAEKRVEELLAMLQEVQLERDELKSQLEKLLSGTSNGFAESDRNLGDMSRFGFKSKSRATIAASAKAPSDPIHSHRTKSFSGVVRPLQMVSENRDNPPPKPKRPPKELMSKLQPPAPAQQEHQTRPRAATMFLRTLFPQR